MKRIVYLFILLAILAGVTLFVYPKSLFPQPQEQTEQQISPNAIVTLVLDYGSNNIATISGVSATNAFDALEKVAKEKNITLKVKQYDFGVFVEQIGTQSNTADTSWIYFVNSIAGTTAADMYQVNTGDTIEWKYTTPLND